MSKNKKIVFGLIGIVVLVIVFYIGVSYGKSKTVALNANGANAQRMGQFGRGNRAGNGGFVSGEIISKDDKSITVKLTEGNPNNPISGSQSGSKIIFFDGSTMISKMATVSVSDLSTGTQISITGTTNSDGSVNAQTISIRPKNVNKI